MVPTGSVASLRYSGMQDEDVVVHARSGSSTAAEHLITKYRYLVELKARTYFVVGADHDDVVQEGMIGLYKAIRDFRHDRFARFRAFADICVTRQIISAVKSATRQKHVPLNGYISLLCPSSDLDGGSCLIDCLPDERAPDPAQCVQGHLDRHSLCGALRGSLSALESSVLQYYLEGRTYREIATVLHCGAKSIDNAIQRVKCKVTTMVSDGDATLLL